ncbi:MAG: DUF2520 domain-containing protein [Chitinophagales bacterium]|nr:DUF2520 domain-containing protein [Chitinophagales bacterium]
MTKIAIIGSGRIAWHLGRRLKAKGLPPRQVISRTAAHAESLARTLQCDWTDDWSALMPDIDLAIIAVRDDAIGDVAAQVAPAAPQTLFVHTSGATPGTVLAPHCARFGVFYPLQSFSYDRVPVWSKIPFCVDANSAEDLLLLKKTAKQIGNLLYHVDDKQRSSLHVAAVFANNFTNHCFAIAEKLLEEKELPFELLHPLMEETLAKALQNAPALMQTGPAVRGDQETIQRHLNLLSGHPEWQKLYSSMTDNIIRQHQSENPGAGASDFSNE